MNEQGIWIEAVKKVDGNTFFLQIMGKKINKCADRINKEAIKEINLIIFVKLKIEYWTPFCTKPG